MLAVYDSIGASMGASQCTCLRSRCPSGLLGRACVLRHRARLALMSVPAIPLPGAPTLLKPEVRAETQGKRC
eukprot:1659911-Alexandrium_andersonii.AAC.1